MPPGTEGVASGQVAGADEEVVARQDAVAVDVARVAVPGETVPRVAVAPGGSETGIARSGRLLGPAVGRASPSSPTSAVQSFPDGLHVVQTARRPLRPDVAAVAPRVVERKAS